MATDASVQPRPKGQLISRTVKDWVRSFLIHLALIPAAVIFLLPFLWMLSTALKPDAQIFAYPPIWIPNPLQWANFPNAVNYIPFLTYLRNTLVIALGSMLGATLSSSLVAYSLARIRWPGRQFLLLLTIATLMLPYQVTII